MLYFNVRLIILRQLQLVNNQMGLERLHLHRLKSSAPGFLLINIVFWFAGDFCQCGCQLIRQLRDAFFSIESKISGTNRSYIVQIQHIANFMVLNLKWQYDTITLGDQERNVVDSANGVQVLLANGVELEEF